MTITKEVEKAIQQALKCLKNVTWSREDLETVLADENIPITCENLLMLYDIFQHLHDLAGQMADD